MLHRYSAYILIAITCSLTIAACDRQEATWHDGIYDVSNVAVSSNLEPALQASIATLSQPDPDRPSIRTFETYRRLRVALRFPESRSAAGDELYALWETEPENALWMALAFGYNRMLDRNEDFEKMMARPALSDTTTALGCYVFGYTTPKRTDRGYWYNKAEGLQHEMTDLNRMFLVLRLSLTESSQGRLMPAIERLIEAIPEARQVGGHALENIFWYYITGRLMAADKLDDALHTATLSAAHARLVDEQREYLNARIRLARILFQRGEYEPSLILLEQYADQGEDLGILWAVQNSLDQAAHIASEIGDYERAMDYDRRNLSVAQKLEDVNNIPRSLASIAHGFRMTGQLDSTFAYLKRAQTIVTESRVQSNQAKMTELMASYYCQVGSYAVAESLLMAASELNDLTGTRTTKAYLLLELVPSALEMGRPDLAYEWLAEVDKVKESLPARTLSNNFLAEFEILSARLLAEQGETRLAAEALARARTSIDAVGGEGRRWTLEAQTGELARRRGDWRKAEIAFTACFDLSLQGSDPQQQARSRFQLGQLYLDGNHFETAQAMFQPLTESESFGHAYRTSLTSRLLLGLTHAKLGEHSQALAFYDEGLVRLNPNSPADLVLRFRLARGRSLSKLGQHQAAADELEGVLNALENSGQLVQFADLQIFRTDIERGTREALVANTVDGNLASSEKMAATTLELVYPGLGNTLADETALIFFLGEESSWSWWIHDGHISWRSLPSRNKLHEMIRPLLVDLSHPERPTDDARLRDLTRALCGDLSSRWRSGTPLTLVLDGILRQVPWAALPAPATGKAFLDWGALREAYAEQISIGQAQPAPPGALRLMAIGCNQPSEGAGDGLPELRQAEAEARQIHDTWNGAGAGLALGEEANWNTMLESGLQEYDVIHLATHAEVHQGAALRSTIRLAGQSSDGQTTSTPVTMVAIRGLSLRAELVYLSSCQAGLSPGGPNGNTGDFTSAFLEAGARSVIASTQWVDDAAARHMAERFYAHWQNGASKATALQMARQDVRAIWKHPAYWAFFRLLGDGS